MSSSLRLHLRSNLVGYVALFVALSAGAYAAGLPKDSVRAKQIKAGAVRNEELADSAVNGAKVADGSRHRPSTSAASCRPGRPVLGAPRVRPDRRARRTPGLNS